MEKGSTGAAVAERQRLENLFGFKHMGDGFAAGVLTTNVFTDAKDRPYVISAAFDLGGARANENVLGLTMKSYTGWRRSNKDLGVGLGFSTRIGRSQLYVTAERAFFDSMSGYHIDARAAGLHLLGLAAQLSAQWSRMSVGSVAEGNVPGLTSVSWSGAAELGPGRDWWIKLGAERTGTAVGGGEYEGHASEWKVRIGAIKQF